MIELRNSSGRQPTSLKPLDAARILEQPNTSSDYYDMDDGFDEYGDGGSAKTNVRVYEIYAEDETEADYPDGDPYADTLVFDEYEWPVISTFLHNHRGNVNEHISPITKATIRKMVFEAMNLEDRDEEVGEYEQVFKSKRDPVELTKVILHLKGKHSGQYTRMAKELEDLLRTIKMAESQAKTSKEDFREAFDILFDAKDALVTRIIDTVSMTITLDKTRGPEVIPETHSIDYQEVVEAIEKLYPKLTNKIEELKIQFATVIPEHIQEPSLQRMTPKLKTEGAMNILRRAAKFIQLKIKDIEIWYNDFMSWLDDFDAMFDDVHETFQDYQEQDYSS